MDLNAPNLKRLNLNSHWLLEVRLWCPKLELLRCSLSGPLAKYEGFMPSLRRARVTLSDLTAEDAAAVGCVIQSVANVSELKIRVSACWVIFGRLHYLVIFIPEVVRNIPKENICSRHNLDCV